MSTGLLIGELKMTLDDDETPRGDVLTIVALDSGSPAVEDDETPRELRLEELVAGLSLEENKELGT